MLNEKQLSVRAFTVLELKIRNLRPQFTVAKEMHIKSSSNSNELPLPLIQVWVEVLSIMEKTPSLTQLVKFY